MNTLDRLEAVSQIVSRSQRMLEETAQEGERKLAVIRTQLEHRRISFSSPSERVQYDRNKQWLRTKLSDQERENRCMIVAVKAEAFDQIVKALSD